MQILQSSKVRLHSQLSLLQKQTVQKQHGLKGDNRGLTHVQARAQIWSMRAFVCTCKRVRGHASLSSTQRFRPQHVNMHALSMRDARQSRLSRNAVTQGTLSSIIVFLQLQSIFPSWDSSSDFLRAAILFWMSGAVMLVFLGIREKLSNLFSQGSPL